MLVRRALALALVVPLLLAGCSQDEPEPKMPDPPTSAEPSPSPSESETPEAESAEEFIRRWAAIEAEMENTGDTAAYRELSADCTACTDLAEIIEGWYEAGGFVKWDGWRVLSVKPRGGSDTEFAVRVRSAPTEYKESAEGETKSFPGGPGAHLLVLEPSGGSWVVVEKAEIGQ